MTDTHTHLYLDDFGTLEDKSLTVSRAFNEGVDRLVFPNVGLDTVEPMLELHRRFPDATTVAMGLHPTETGENWKEDLKKMESWFNSLQPKAVGEVGIDLYWDKTFRDEQMEVFSIQLGWAKERDLPVIIHCREGLDETLDCIRKAEAESLPLIFHSFTGSPDDVRKIREVCDPFFGINGVVTFKNAAPLREALPEIGSGRILLETDSPYLAPVPHRGKQNQSAFLPFICNAAAQALGISPGELEKSTDQNALKLFFHE